MVNFGCIYLITNLINRKVYVGQHNTSDPLKRWKVHIRSANAGSTYAIHGAIRKYGKDNFKIETLCICKHDALGLMEAYYAEQYESYVWDPSPGYNMAWCGKNFRLGIPHTKEAREKLRTVNIGRKQSEDTIKKRIASNIGKKRSQESCDRISAGKRAKGISEEAMQKIVERTTGKKMSLEARENMKKAHAARKQQSLEPTLESSRPKREYPCDQCDKVLPKLGSLKLHKRTHSQEKPYVCDVCSKGYACSSNLDEHKFIHNPKSFKCDDCPKLFNYAKTLKSHKKKFHSAS